jgi:uncharacterized membrane protein HdeD (DUF308 family)
VKTWISSALKGLIALAFGGLILVSPSKAIVSLASYFGFFAIISGVISLFYAFFYRRSGVSGNLWFLEGSFTILVGLIIIFYPENTVRIAIVFFGILALIMGVTQLMAYLSFRKTGVKAGIILASAVISLILGILLIFNPFESAEIIAIIIAIYALFYGIVSLVTAFRLFSAGN